MDAHLKAGIAIYNSKEFHAAHDAWEDHWLGLEKNTRDEQFLHGLIQFTAAIYHGTTGNWEGLQGLAGSALEYLSPLPTQYQNVDLGPLRDYLLNLAHDPEHIERHAPPQIRYDGSPLQIEELTINEQLIVASILAGEHDEFDEVLIERAIDTATQAMDANRSSQYIGMLTDFAADSNQRHLIYDRLSTMISRKQHRDNDVRGLFEE